MVSRENVLRAAVGTKKIRKTVRARTGSFHRMDRELAKWVWETRRLGIPVETYMLAIEGERIINELYPEQFAEDGTCRFKFSPG